MKHSLNLLIIILLCKSIAAQKITYQPVFINPCDSTEEAPYIHFIDKKRHSYKLNQQTKSIILPDTGQYKLGYSWIYTIHDMYYSIDITSKGIINDTFFMPSLKIKLLPIVEGSKLSEYRYCGKLADGKIVTHYYNGNIRMSGTFKNGQPIDSIKSYYESGILSALDIVHNKRKFQFFQYYRNGKTRWNFNVTKRRINTTEYYSSGQLSSISNRNKHFEEKTVIEYHENGLLKLKKNTKRLHKYSTQGKLTDKIWRRKNRRSNTDIPSYKYKWTSFDENGEIKRMIIFKGKDKFPKTLKNVNSSNISKILFYDNNKKKYKFEMTYADVDTQEPTFYKKTHSSWKVIDPQKEQKLKYLLKQFRKDIFKPPLSLPSNLDQFQQKGII